MTSTEFSDRLRKFEHARKAFQDALAHGAGGHSILAHALWREMEAARQACYDDTETSI